MKSGKKTQALALFSESFTLFLKDHRSVSKGHGEKLRKGLFSNKKDNKDSGGHKGLDQQIFSTNNKLLRPVVSENMENILNVVVENVRPLIEIRKVRVARATYLVPAQISRLKGETLALRWIIEFANKEKKKTRGSLAQALAFELACAYKKLGGPRQRRSELHKLAEANRSYIRYRWW